MRFWACSFKYFWEHKDESEIEGHWDEYIEAERKRSRRGEKLGFVHAIKYLSTFTNWLFKTGRIEKRPILHDPNWLASEDQAEKVKHIFTDEEATAMMAQSSGAFGLYIRMALLMGMRSSEITQLKKDRIEIINSAIKLRAIDTKTGSKTGKGRTISIHDQVMPALKAQYTTSNSDYLFPSKKDPARPMDRLGFKGQWDKLMAKIGVEHATPHNCRHTCATKMFSNPNLNPALICKSLGFSMAIAQKTYINFSDKDLALVAKNQSYGESKNETE
jgi:integrase